MVKIRSVSFLLCLTAAMYACGRYGPEVGLNVAAHPPSSRLAPGFVPAEPRLDRFGNELEPAVSDYRFDPDGELYERHSPQTQIGGLGVPST